ncbi:MAG: RsbRD N-terminal domain-containing protein [Desulfatiglans sp.]|jgi:hypothetical protein|nr:RsbRD N-terminal domain-containing protein [Thermodesulfobacteriota bacterium]MEE4353845.1 RsbRD N-terminal domain-containing protein [Desulfatiglans sp.]
MSLTNILAEKKSDILKKWCDTLFETYPKETQRFFKKENNRFANPVGNAIDDALEALLDEVINPVDPAITVSSLDSIVRIRAVQDFTPSQSLSFIFRLKDILREESDIVVTSNGTADSLRALEDRIDQMALIGFDLFSQCRQKLYEIRVNEVKGHVGRLLERANLISEIPGSE